MYSLHLKGCLSLHKRQRAVSFLTLGSVLVEILVGTLLSLSIAAILLREVGALGFLQKKTQSQYQLVHHFHLADSYLKKVVRDFDTHPLQLPPKLHHNGLITLANGQPHAVMNGSKPPHPDSSALSAYRLATQHTLQVIQTLNGDLVACPRYENFGAALYKKGFVGILANQTLELQGTVHYYPAASHCFLLALYSVDSVSHEKQNWLVPFVRTLIPIKEHYTLYIDTENNLRYLGHNGKLIKENQPVATHIEKLTLSLSPAYKQLGLQIQTTLTSNNSKIFNTSAVSSVLKSQPENFIFSAN